MAAGGKAINLGELAIAIALKTGALEQGLKEVQKKLKDHGKKVQKTGADYDKLAIVAGVAFYKIASAITSSVKAFNDFNNSMVGLRSIVQGTGSSFQEAQGFIDNYIKDGLIPASDAATALKNLLARGFELGEATTIMNRFKDSAAFGRQASLSLGEAVKSATEGLKNENSILVDNAGVTKNVSVMWKEYAESIGKGVDSLTNAEKRQAELTGIMKETRFQIGDAAKYSQQFAGAQAKAAAESLKLNQALGGAIVPSLNELLGVATPVISAITSFVKTNPELVAAVALTATAFLGLVTAMTALAAGAKILAPAITQLGTALTFLEAHPVVIALTAIAAALATIYLQTKRAKKAQEDYNKAVLEYNKIVKEGITKSEIPAMQEKIDKLKELEKQYVETSQKLKTAQEFLNSFEGTTRDIFSMGILPGPRNERDEYYKQLQKITEQMKAYGATQETINSIIADYEEAVKAANRVTLQEHNDQAKTIAQKRQQIMETENIIKAYKNAEKSSSDWKKAQKELADQFPQFSTASGIIIDAIEDVVAAQNDQVKQEWNNLQDKIRLSIAEVELEIQKKNAILATNKARLAAADSVAGQVTTSTRVMQKWGEEISRQEADVKKQKDAIQTMYDMLNTPIEEIAGIKPVDDDYDYTPYENKALDSAMRIHNHKVALDKLTKEQEIASLETILRAYAKTADERMDLDERIYKAKQGLRERDLAATEKAIEDEAQKLADRTTLSERWIDRTKLRGELTTQDEVDAYNRIIKYHREYLDKIKADAKIAAEDKKRIIEEETRYIQDQQDKILSIQKASVDKAVRAYIDAKQKQYDTEEDMENDRLSKKLKALDKEYSDKERALEAENRASDLNSLYEQERKYANAATKEGQNKLADIREQIARLQAEATKDELEAEKAERRAAIEQDIQDNQEKYKRLNADLESEKEKMLAAAVDYAKKANTTLVDGQTAIAKSLSDVIRQFDTQSTSLITQGMDKLRRLIDGYKSIMEGISLSPNFELAGTGGLTIGKAGNKGTSSVVINDYGDKILSGVDDIQDYGKELVTGAENAGRG